jgi:hypothetical protein
MMESKADQLPQPNDHDKDEGTFELFWQQGHTKLLEARELLNRFETYLNEVKAAYDSIDDKTPFKCSTGIIQFDIQGWGYTYSPAPIDSSPPKVSSREKCECPAPRVVDFSCSHSVCAKCFQATVLATVTSHDFSIDKVKCGTCRALIDRQKLFEVFGGATTFYSKVEEQLTEDKDSLKPSFVCGICAETKIVEGCVTLDCEHRFCRSCMKDYCADLIGHNLVTESDLHCPQARCRREISEATLSHCLESDDYERLVRLRTNQLYLPSRGEKLTKCPAANCDFQMFIEAGRDDFPCVKCKQRTCLNCKQLHLDQHKCNQLAQIQAEKERAAEFESVMAAVEAKRCPVCKEGLAKEGGCNYVQCCSAVCSRRTYFCWLCSIVLSPKDHYAHFPDGPYGSRCLGQSK